jgi:hypothetical protein
MCGLNRRYPPTPRSSDFYVSGQIRRYYVAAEQVTWNYVSSGYDNWFSVPIEVFPRAKAAGYTAEGFLGTQRQKVMYRGYTDVTFTEFTS